MSWQDKRSNEWVLEQIGSRLLVRDLIRRERKLKYFGHIMRRENSIENQIMQGTLEGHRGRGHPITAWTDEINVWSGGSMAKATNISRDRGRMVSFSEGHSSAYGHQMTTRGRERERKRERLQNYF